ncbi:MAG TPA: 50S ribosomal protein L18 [Candidatus Levybacteria bacterium]|nr:50S ribosomal protein L18 [Candidatus Levybacteria bacterium]
MSEVATKKQRKTQRVQRVRKKLLNQAGKLRLSVFASNQAFYAQIIDDAKAETVVSVAVQELKAEKGTKVERAAQLGTLLAQKAKDKKISGSIVFDKGRYKYHGRVKAFADAAREGGLKF